MFELYMVVAGIVMLNILELIMEIVPNYPTLQTSALGGPTLSTRIEASVDIKLFSGAIAGEVR
jgi:hypothetical protein